MKLQRREEKRFQAQNLSEPELQHFPNESDSFLNKRSQKTGVTLQHKDTFYADDAAFNFLTKEDLINGTTFIQKTFSQLGLEVHLGHR